MRFLALGASGMAGHIVALYLQEQGHEVLGVSRRSPGLDFPWQCLDVQAEERELQSIIRRGNFDAVINCAGILNADAEEHKAAAAYVNAYLPHRLAELTQHMPTRVIHISTDCVFSGDRGDYEENSLRDGRTFYDRSKALGELEDDKNLTFRSSIIGPDINKNGIGLFNWFMQQQSPVKGYAASIWNGITTLTLSRAIEKAAETGITGLYHLTPPESVSKYELLKKFSAVFRSDRISVEKVPGVAANKTLRCTRGDFPFTVPDYDKMLVEVHDWLLGHKSSYPHYGDIR